MKNAFLALLFGFAKSVLTNVSQILWDSMWEILFEAVEEAEKKWTKEGMGQRKKDFVKKKVMTFIEEKANLNFIQKKAISIFLDRMIDGIVEAINDELGKDWVDKVGKYEDELAGKISFIQ